MCLVQIEDRIAFLNSKFDEVVPLGRYSHAEPFNAYELAIVADEGKWGIVNKQGEVCLPLSADYIEHPNESSYQSPRFAVLKDGRVQLLNERAKPFMDDN